MGKYKTRYKQESKKEIVNGRGNPLLFLKVVPVFFSSHLWARSLCVRAGKMLGKTRDKKRALHESIGQNQREINYDDENCLFEQIIILILSSPYQNLIENNRGKNWQRKKISIKF